MELRAKSGTVEFTPITFSRASILPCNVCFAISVNRNSSAESTAVNPKKSVATSNIFTAPCAASQS